MIDIGSTNFLIKVPSLKERDFERYSSDLFDTWDENVQKALFLPDYSISLVVEEGSISGRAKIAAAAGALYMGIANYGGFISGIQIIRSQVSYVNNVLFESAKSPFDCSRNSVTVKNSGESLSKLYTLFHRVQKCTLTADQAMLLAVAIFGKEGENVPGLIQHLKRELENAPKYPEQLSLLDDIQDELHEAIVPPSPKIPQKRHPKPVPVSQEYRIEIWRGSKKGKRHIKLTKP